jgi:hypothetical protein
MPKGENKDPKPAFGGKAGCSLRVLGNEENPGEGLLSIGNYMALDHSRGAAVYLWECGGTARRPLPQEASAEQGGDESAASHSSKYNF